MAHYDCKYCGAGIHQEHSPYCSNNPKVVIKEGSWLANCDKPIGLLPKKDHDLERMWEIFRAMGSYMEDAKEIPQDWIEEFAELNEGL